MARAITCTRSRVIRAIHSLGLACLPMLGGIAIAHTETPSSPCDAQVKTPPQPGALSRNKQLRRKGRSPDRPGRSGWPRPTGSPGLPARDGLVRKRRLHLARAAGTERFLDARFPDHGNPIAGPRTRPPTPRLALAAGARRRRWYRFRGRGAGFRWTPLPGQSHRRGANEHRRRSRPHADRCRREHTLPALTHRLSVPDRARAPPTTRSARSPGNNCRVSTTTPAARSCGSDPRPAGCR